MEIFALLFLGVLCVLRVEILMLYFVCFVCFVFQSCPLHGATKKAGARRRPPLLPRSA